MDVWCFPERKDRDEDDQGKCGVSLKERTEMRVIRWMCGVSLKERTEMMMIRGSVVFP